MSLSSSTLKTVHVTVMETEEVIRMLLRYKKCLLKSYGLIFCTGKYPVNYGLRETGEYLDEVARWSSKGSWPNWDEIEQLWRNASECKRANGSNFRK